MGLLSSLFGKKKTPAQSQKLKLDIDTKFVAADGNDATASEWDMMDDVKLSPKMQVPDFDLSNPGFPFDNVPYMTIEQVCVNRQTGEVYREDRTYYANKATLLKFTLDLIKLEGMISPEERGIYGVPFLETDFKTMIPCEVEDLWNYRKEIPENVVAMTLNPTTKTGRKSKYPLKVRFAAIDQSCLSFNGSLGEVSYMQSGCIGKATLNYWLDGVHFQASFKIGTNGLDLSSLTYCNTRTNNLTVELLKEMN